MEPTPTDPIAALVEQLVELAAPVSQILDHMARAPGGGDIAGSLRTVLRDVLAPLAEDHPAHDLEVAAAIVEAVTARMVGEIYLVPHAPPPNRRSRRAARRPC